MPFYIDGDDTVNVSDILSPKRPQYPSFASYTQCCLGHVNDLAKVFRVFTNVHCVDVIDLFYVCR